MFAERRETAELFGSLSSKAVSLIKGIRNWRRLRFRRPGSKDLANAWLEFQYGVKPLASDMFSALEELESANVPKPVVEAKLSFSRHWDVPYTFVYTPTRMRYFIAGKVKAKARVELDTTFWDNFLARHGMLNIAALGWELIPFSFVVDWWVNVGEVLQSLDSALFVKSIKGFISHKYEDGSLFSDSTYRYYSMHRSAEAFPLVANFVFNDKVSLTHVLNGLALWRSLLK
jgi:hypothetical protein